MENKQKILSFCICQSEFNDKNKEVEKQYSVIDQQAGVLF